MSVFFPNTFRKAAEADIDHARYAPNLWIFWAYTLYDFWTVVGVGYLVYLFLMLPIFGIAAMSGFWFTTISTWLLIANFTSIAVIFRRAQKAFSGKSEKEISDIPFAFGAVLMLIATFHSGIVLGNWTIGKLLGLIFL